MVASSLRGARSLRPALPDQQTAPPSAAVRIALHSPAAHQGAFTSAGSGRARLGCAFTRVGRINHLRPGTSMRGSAVPEQETQHNRREESMSKVVECAKVDPSSGCTHVIRGKDERELLKNAMDHAKGHGVRDVTPELQAKVRAAMHDE